MVVYSSLDLDPKPSRRRVVVRHPRPNPRSQTRARAGTDGDPLIGRVLDGRYRITAKIGAGGMSIVYRAIQLTVEREVAIKVLAHGMSTTDRAVERFRNEARAIALLRHPNTIKLHDVGRLSDGRLYLVTELLGGRPLDQLLKERALSPRRAVRLLQQVAESLEEAHAAGIVHRDLKPANLFLDRVGEADVVKVLDFGVAKLGQQGSISAAGAIFGTPRYMSPEQARGNVADA